MALPDHFNLPNVPSPNGSPGRGREYLPMSIARGKTPPTDAETAARAALRNAIAVLLAREAAAQDAAKRVARAVRMVAAAGAALARYDDLVAARRERAEACKHLAQTEELRADVAREAAAGTAAVAAATARVQACALAVMREMAQKEGVRMRQAEADAAQQRALVVAYSDTLGLADRVSGSLPPSLGMLLFDPWNAAFLEMSKADVAADRATWTDLRQRLASDPDATLEG